MSNISVRMALNENASNKLKSIASAGREAAKQLSAAGKEIDKAFNSKAPTSFASSAGSAFSSIENHAESLGNAIDDALDGFDEFSSGSFRGAETAFSSASESADDFAESASKAGESVDNLKTSASGLGDGLGGLGDGADGMDDFADKADDAGESMDKASSKAGTLGSALQKLFAVVAGAVVLDKIKDFTMDSINVGSDFTSMMSEVQAISGASSSELSKMEETARSYGATTVFSATEAAEALKYMSLAGWDANQSSQALGGVLNLAAASGMGLGEASDMVTDYLSAFGMEASKSTYFADMLSYAQSNSNTTAAQLGEAYRNAAANMHAAGQDVETTTSLLEAMANQGYKGSEAGTALAATMRDITQKMENGAIKIGDTSVAVQDSQGNFRDLTDILTDVENATNGMGDAEKAAALGTTFTSDSIKALNMILTEGMSKVSGYEDALRNAGGTAEDMAGTMNDNLAGDVANMNSAFEEMKLQVFENLEGPLREGAQYLTEEIIPDLTSWVPEAFGSAANGISKVGNALKPLFETILKNPQAIGDTFVSIGAGFATMKTVSAGMKIADKVTEAGGMVSALKKFGATLFGNPWAAGAAAAVAALTAVGFAIHSYNQQQIDSSFSEHFGDIELSAEQISDVASHIINATWLVDIQTALGHFDNAETAKKQAEEALQENDAIEWKARIGISLTEDETSTYMQNIATFTDNIQNALQEQTIAAEMTISSFGIKMADGSSLADQISEWAASDLQDMSYLSAGLTNLVQTALEDGIIDVDEQAAIDQLQSKISNIMAGWKESEAQAEMDMLTRKYGRLSGQALTEDTFEKVVEELADQRETAASALEESEKKLYATLNSLNRKDENGVQRISDEELVSYKQQAGYAARNSEASMLGNSLQFETNTLSDAYGAKLNENRLSIESSTSEFLKNANNYLANQDYGSLFDSMQYGYTNAMTGTNIFSSKDQKALSKVFDAMKPDVESMTGLIDEYREMGQAIPQDVMTAFNDAMMVGAAAGDADAAWQVFANQMVADPASEALVQAIQEGTVSVPEELRTALERATAETTDEPVTIEGMQADLENVEVNEEHVGELINKAFDGLEATGVEKTINGTATVEYEVVAGDTLSGIASKVGSTVDELLKYNPQITNPDLINVGATINIPKELVAVEASGVGEATDEAIQSETGNSETETEVQVNVTTSAGTVDDTGASEAGQAAEDAAQSAAGGETTVDKTVTSNTTYVPGVTDTSQVENAATEELSSGSAKQEIVTDTTYVPGTTDTSQVTSATENALKEQTISSTATTNVTAQMGTDNFDATTSAFASKFQSALTSAFNKTFHATTNASITVNYSIANPSKTITFSGGGSGTATVYAHASGGIFDTPHYGVLAEAGPEAYIPLDGSENAKSIWQQAGEMLGMFGDDKPIQTSPDTVSKADTGAGGGSKSISKEINININGSGNLRVGGGVSKDDVVQILMEKAREVFVNIVEEEALVGGDASYEF